MTDFTKVTMYVTDTDIDNAKMLSQIFHTKGNGGAVSTALGITRSLIEMMAKGNELLLRKRNGKIVKLFLQGFNDDDEN